MKEYIIEYEAKQKRIQGVVELIAGVLLLFFVSKYIIKFIEFLGLGIDVVSQTTPIYILVFAIFGWIIALCTPLVMIFWGWRHLYQIDKLEFEGIKPTEKVYLSDVIKIISIKERKDTKQKNKLPFKEKVIYQEK